MWHLLGIIYFVLTHEDITTHWIMGLGHELAFVREFILMMACVYLGHCALCVEHGSKHSEA